MRSFTAIVITILLIILSFNTVPAQKAEAAEQAPTAEDIKAWILDKHTGDRGQILFMVPEASVINGFLITSPGSEALIGQKISITAVVSNDSNVSRRVNVAVQCFYANSPPSGINNTYRLRAGEGQEHTTACEANSEGTMFIFVNAFSSSGNSFTMSRSVMVTGKD